MSMSLEWMRATLLSDPNELLHSKLRKAEVVDEGGGTVKGLLSSRR